MKFIHIHSVYSWQEPVFVPPHAERLYKIWIHLCMFTSPVLFRCVRRELRGPSHRSHRTRLWDALNESNDQWIWPPDHVENYWSSSCNIYDKYEFHTLSHGVCFATNCIISWSHESFSLVNHRLRIWYFNTAPRARIGDGPPPTGA